jgi:hypothetical protein
MSILFFMNFLQQAEIVKNMVTTKIVISTTVFVIAAGSAGMWYFSSPNTPPDQIENMADEKVEVISRSIGGGYEIKPEGVFYLSGLMEGADKDTFEYLGGDYAKDARRVYLGSDVVVGADPKTLQRIEIEDTHFIKDATKVFIDKQIIIGADPATFEYVGGPHSKDSTKVFWFQKTIVNADPKTFEDMKDGYAKDAKNAYFNGVRLSGTDANTFEYVGNSYAKDSKHVVWYGNVVSGVSPVDCTAVNLKGCEGR